MPFWFVVLTALGFAQGVASNRSFAANHFLASARAVFVPTKKHLLKAVFLSNHQHRKPKTKACMKKINK